MKSNPMMSNDKLKSNEVQSNEVQWKNEVQWSPSPIKCPIQVPNDVPWIRTLPTRHHISSMIWTVSWMTSIVPQRRTYWKRAFQPLEWGTKCTTSMDANWTFMTLEVNERNATNGSIALIWYIPWCWWYRWTIWTNHCTKKLILMQCTNHWGCSMNW